MKVCKIKLRTLRLKWYVTNHSPCVRMLKIGEASVSWERNQKSGEQGES